MYKTQSCIGDSTDEDDLELIAEVGYIASRLRILEETFWGCVHALGSGENKTGSPPILLSNNCSRSGSNEHSNIDTNWVRNYISSINYYYDDEEDEEDDEDDKDEKKEEVVEEGDKDIDEENVHDRNDEDQSQSQSHESQERENVHEDRASEVGSVSDGKRLVNLCNNNSSRINKKNNSYNIKCDNNNIEKLKRRARRRNRRRIIEDLLIKFYEDYERKKLLHTQNCGMMNNCSPESTVTNTITSTTAAAATTTATATATATTTTTNNHNNHVSTTGIYPASGSVSSSSNESETSGTTTAASLATVIQTQEESPINEDQQDDQDSQDDGGIIKTLLSRNDDDTILIPTPSSSSLEPARHNIAESRSLPGSRIDVISSTIVTTTLTKAKSALFPITTSTTTAYFTPASSDSNSNSNSNNNNNIHVSTSPTPTSVSGVSGVGGGVSDVSDIHESDKKVDSDDVQITTVTTTAAAAAQTAKGDYNLIQFKNTIKYCQFSETDLRAVVRDLKRKIEYTERMNWLCLSKRPMAPPRRKASMPRHTEVKKKFLEICDNTLSDEVRAALRLPAFDSYEWEDADVIHLMQTMFMELGLVDKFSIPLGTLREWLYEVYKHYNEVPFHNFRHCFCVAQMMYVIAKQANLISRLGELEVFILLVSCICHDLDHPGYNNIYQINARTELALRYNDISPLENHHCSIAFRLLEHPDCNIFKNFNRETFNEIREGIIRCILATDMARHNEILTQFKEVVQNFDYTNRAHVNLLCMVLIKVADISNEARPLEVAEPWLDRLLQEFFAQSAAEKSEGLPVTPFMDPEKVTRPGSQVRFIGLVLLPLFEALADLLPELHEVIIAPVHHAFDYYKRLNDAQMKSRKSLVEAAENSSDGGTGSVGGNGSANTTGGGSSPQLPRSQSGISVRSRRSIPSQKSASRTSVDEPTCIAAELHDLPEGSESGDSETATEVDVAEKTSKFKVDTEGSNRSKSSHSNSRKSSREKRPSMISEMCSSGGRMRNSYGNIHGYHTNRCHFGSNRAVSLDQYSCNNRRLSDGLQQVISDSNVFYNRHNRSLDNEVQTNSNNLGDKPKKMEGNVVGSSVGGEDAINMNIPGPYYDVMSVGGHHHHYQHHHHYKQKDHHYVRATHKSGNTNNGNSEVNTGHSAVGTVGVLSGSGIGGIGVVGSAESGTSQNGTKTWKERFKQITELFTFGFDRRNKRLGNTSSARTTPCSVRNNNLTEPLKPGMRYTISNNLTLSMKQKQKIMDAGRNRAYSLDVPARNRYSSSSGGDSRKSSRNDDNSNRHDPLTEDNNSNHTSSGDMPLGPTIKIPPGGGDSSGADFGATTATQSSVLYITLDGAPTTTTCSTSPSPSAQMATTTTTTSKPLKITGGCSSYTSTPGGGYDDAGLYDVPESGTIMDRSPAIPPDIAEHKI